MEFSSKISSPYRIRLLLVVHTAFSIFQKRCTIYLHLSNGTLLLRTLLEEERCQDIFLAIEREEKFEERRRKLNYERYLIKRELETNAARSR